MGVLRVKGASFFVVFFSFALVREKTRSILTIPRRPESNGICFDFDGSKKKSLSIFLFPGGGELMF